LKEKQKEDKHKENTYKKKYKIMFCNVPIRQEPSSFPPVACTTLCNILIKAGYDTFFYDIDAKRPPINKIGDFIKNTKFDMVAISAVVSTSYQYVKDLASIIKKNSPGIKVILGGNLAAAYKIILRKCQVDLCAIGEGEKSILNIVRYFEKYGNSINHRELSKIKGIVFLDSNNNCKFTGYEELIDNDQIQQPDYDFLKKYSDIDRYILNPMSRYDFAYDSRSCDKERVGRKMATVFTSKGCVNKCTFCHRWISKYRIIPVQKIIDYMKYLIRKYNVGFFCLEDESFGENKYWIDEFIKLIGPLDILFQIAGARVSIVKRDPSIIVRLKEVGLTAIYFGMESGSDRILRVMEKNATVADNFKTAKACIDAGIYTVIQLIIGMPGENDRTINETVKFLKNIAEINPHIPATSTNYLQALPGTPCYEYLRYHGLLGKTIDDEEEYLLNISNINASQFSQYINVSEDFLAKVRLWNSKINILPKIYWFRIHGWKGESDVVYRPLQSIKKNNLIFRIKKFLRGRVIVYRIIYFMGDFFWKVIYFRNKFLIYGLKKTLFAKSHITISARSSFIIDGNGESIRKLLQKKQFFYDEKL